MRLTLPRVLALRSRRLTETAAGPITEMRGSGSLPSQGRWPQLCARLLAGDGRHAEGADRTRRGDPPCGQPRRLRAALSTDLGDRDRRLIGFEALVRMHAEDGTLIPPLRFIPVAEELHLIDKIGAWVLREACRTAATWPKHLTVAVNVSVAQFEAGGVSRNRRRRAQRGRPRAQAGSNWRLPKACCSATKNPRWPSCRRLRRWAWGS